MTDRIVADPAVLCGKPVIRGTRLAVEFVVDLMAQGWTVEQITDNYPGLSRADVQACLAYAGELLRSERAGSP
jgi:uncharacterized protein (DUF433 family)